MKQLPFISLLILFSCTKSGITEKDIPGTWKTTEYDVELYKMNKTMEAIIKDIALSTVHHFNKDGSWSTTMKQDAKLSGEWSFNEAREELTLTSSSFEKDQIWLYKNDFKFEYQSENSNGKVKRIISKE
jgi:hypothetical protein